MGNYVHPSGKWSGKRVPRLRGGSATLFFVLGLVVLLVLSPVVLAKSTYVSTFEEKYPAAKGSKLASCTLCHAGDFSLNPYGKDFAAANDDFGGVEAKDSDGDGFSNLEEIKALTFPGDATDKPTPPPVSSPTPPATEEKAVFADTKGHPSREAVNALFAAGVVSGTSDGRFSPSRLITRSEFVTMVLRALKLPGVSPVLPTFTDVRATDPSAAYFYPFVEAAYRAGIVQGYGDRAFRPADALEKEAAVQIMVQALGWGDEVKNLKDEEVTATLSGVGDQKDISQYRRPYVALAIKRGLLAASGNLEPLQKLTRGEAAILLKAACDLLDRSKAYANLKNYALGPNTCQTCHGDQHQNWLGTMHSRMVQPVTKPGATFANFATNKAFRLEDAVYVIGGLTNQRFLSADFKYLNAYWDMKSRQWMDYKGGTSWLAACAGCHTVGYNKTNLTFVAFGISCESCHGPGAQHVAGGGDKSKISVTTSDQACASCHGGQAKELESMGHATFFAQQLATNPGYKDYCITCHSVTAFLAKEKGQPVPKLADFKTGALKDDRLGITCVVCHDPHNSKEEAQLRKSPLATCTQCHTANLADGAKLAAGKEVHHPQKEMFLGVGGYGVADTPHAKVATCVDCHMKGLDNEGVTHVNHEFKVMVDDTLQTKHGPVTVNACQQCHTKMSKEDLKAYQEAIDQALNQVKTSLDNLKAKVDGFRNDPARADLVKKYDEAYTNWSFVTNDKSHGIHNYKYATALLKAAQAALETVASTP